MFATPTSRGQLTLPKEIRDRLGLDTGSVLDFALQPDNTITVRAVKPDARRIRKLLISPHTKALKLEQQHEAVGQCLTHKHAPVKRMRTIKRG
jgi:antitoxin PrlF